MLFHTLNQISAKIFSNNKGHTADLDILTIIQTNSFHIEPNQITDETYYQSSMIELLRTMKFDCSLEYNSSLTCDNPIEIIFNNMSIGLQLATITFNRYLIFYKPILISMFSLIIHLVVNKQLFQINSLN